MTARIVRAGRGGDHRHADDLTPRGLTAWLSCPTCQHGHPVPVTADTARAIATILTALTGGQRPQKGGNPA